MLSRREILVGGVMAGLSGIVRGNLAYAAASMPSTKVNFAVPPGATDCAVHVYEPKRFPYGQGRTYTPEPATVAELRQFLQALGLERVVVVQATPYGTDNACVVASLRELGNRARGVAIIDDKTPAASLDEMHQAGVRGVRLSLNATSDAATARQRLKHDRGPAADEKELEPSNFGKCGNVRDPSRGVDGTADASRRGSFRSGANRGRARPARLRHGRRAGEIRQGVCKAFERRYVLRNSRTCRTSRRSRSHSSKRTRSASYGARHGRIRQQAQSKAARRPTSRFIARLTMGAS